MMVIVEVDVCRTRPPKVDDTVRVAVGVTSTLTDAELEACQVVYAVTQPERGRSQVSPLVPTVAMIVGSRIVERIE